MGDGGERAALDAAHVAVYGAYKSHQAKGGGVLLADNTILTCAHVVNLALGHGDDAFRQQMPVRQGELLPGVTVSFPRLASPNGDGKPWRSSVTLERWQPAHTVTGKAPHTGTRLPWAGDLALLCLVEPPPDGVRPADWSHAHHTAACTVSAGRAPPACRAAPRQ